MNYPIRDKGLQVDAAISMGNSLYAVLVGVIIGVLIVLLSDSENKMCLFGFGNTAGNSLVSGGCMAFALLLWLIYYFLDWYDLNMVLVYDNYMGPRQVLFYFFCILAISLCVVLSLLGKANLLVIIASIYASLVTLLRDKLIDAAPMNSTNQEAYNYAKQVQWDSITTLLLLVMCFLGFVSGCLTVIPSWQYLSLGIEWAKFLNPCATVLIGIVAVIVKLRRSKYKIQPEYQAAVVAIKGNKEDKS